MLEQLNFIKLIVLPMIFTVFKIEQKVITSSSKILTWLNWSKHSLEEALKAETDLETKEEGLTISSE